MKKKNVILKTKVLRIINDYKIDLVIPILDFELKFFSILAKNLKDHRTHILIANSKLIDIFLDKEKSSNYFNLINVKQPKTFIQTSILKSNIFSKKKKYLIKDRFGSTSKNIHILNSYDDYLFYKNKIKKFIIQEYINFDNEYTVGVIKYQNSIVSIISFKRKLTNGNTSYVESGHFPNVDKFASQLADKIIFDGPLNIQILEKNKKLYVVEVNPRFSGTTYFRTLFGINQPKLLIDLILNKNIKKQNSKKIGKAVRLYEEKIIP